MLNKPLVIGIGAKAQQGKNTVANTLQATLKAFGYAQLYSIADELKYECKAHHDSLLQQFMDVHGRAPKPPKQDPSYGWAEILQWHGSAVRVHDPNRWLMSVGASIDLLSPQFAIISDIRYPNEAQWVKDRGGKLIEVKRLVWETVGDGAHEVQYVSPDRDPAHESETALDGYQGWDYTIEAPDGDVEALTAAAQIVASTIMDGGFEKHVVVRAKRDSHPVAGS